MRILITDMPFPPGPEAPWAERGRWPCAWIAVPGAGEPPFVAAYRLRFTLDTPATVRAHVTADERYELFLDGERIGRGSERGDADHWFFETYELALAAGAHVLAARVWSLGALAPYAQMRVRHGLLFAPEPPFTDLLATGRAAWEAKLLPGYTFVDPSPAWGTGANLLIDGRAYPWGVECGEGSGWQPAAPTDERAGAPDGLEMPAAHRLCPATLPPMLERELRAGSVRLVAAVPSLETQPIPVRAADHLVGEPGWADLLAGRGAVSVPPHTARRVIIDLGNYFCAYPEIVTSGGAGATVRLLWAESLYTEPVWWHNRKGDRNAIEGKYFCGVGDTFLPDGGPQRRFTTLWWQAGRYLELAVSTGAAPLTIERLTLRETRYPLEMESAFAASDGRLAQVVPLLVRGVQASAHETYADSPYYEQLMYASDTRLETLVTYVMSRDDRLPRKALRMFDASRLASGLTQARYPTRVRQVIPSFALWWALMVGDYARWRGDRAFVAGLMPGVRATIESFGRLIGPDGLVGAPGGWPYLDWVPTWESGVPPGGATGPSGPLNWLLAHTLVAIAELEAWLGEPELAARNRRRAAELAARLTEVFWDAERDLFADDPAHRSFSEHSQCLALLSGLLDDGQRERVAAGLLADPGLARTTISFTHYLFEAYRLLGRADALLGRMGLWFELAERGFVAPIEMPEPSRSDCHGWGSHPLYHYFATILGVRPEGFGFERVEIAPQPGPLAWVRGRLVHPRGAIAVELRQEGGALRGRVALPPGVGGVFRHGGRTLPLAPGSETEV